MYARHIIKFYGQISSSGLGRTRETPQGRGKKMKRVLIYMLVWAESKLTLLLINFSLSGRRARDLNLLWLLSKRHLKK